MDLRQTEYILAINEEKSITRAAERLFITQSALNQQLGKLEAELGAPLFERNRSAWKPTAAGEIYIKMGMEMLRMRKSTYEEIRDLSDARCREIHIGLIQERGVDMFTALYPRFHRAFPEVVLEPEEMNVATIRRNISAGKLDLGLCTLEESQKDENVYHHMCTEDILLAVPKKMYEEAAPVLAGVAVSDASEVSDASDAAVLQHFGDLPFILMRDSSTLHTIEMRLLQGAGISPKVLFTTSSNLSKYRIVSSGMGCAFIPRVFAAPNPEVTYIRLPSGPAWEVTLCTQKDAYITRAEEYFIDLCRNYWSEKIPSPSNPEASDV